jgi:hypothetical protein
LTVLSVSWAEAAFAAAAAAASGSYFFTLLLAAVATSLHSLPEILANSSGVALVGLGKQSTAPSSSAFSVTSAPFCVRVDSMTIGIGFVVMISSRKSMPFMPGISMSSVTTSGFMSSIISRASSAFAAAPMTTRSLDRSNALENSARIVIESSTTRTLIAGIIFLPSPL